MILPITSYYDSPVYIVLTFLGRSLSNIDLEFKEVAWQFYICRNLCEIKSFLFK